MGINIDQITRTLTTIVGDERMVGRDDLGDFKVTIDDLLESLAGKFAPGYIIEYVKNGDPAVNGDNVILLQGQTVLIADYQNAFDAVYKDQTTPAFFKCDADGTPNASGLYFIMQDRRAVVPKGIGSQTIPAITGRVKSGPTELSTVEEDRGQGHRQSELSGNKFSVVGSAGVTQSYGYGTPSGYLFKAEQTTTGDPVTDGTNGTPRTGATFRENAIGTIWGLTY